MLLNYARVNGVSTAGGRVDGVVVRDEESGEELRLGARAVINATGAFADGIRTLVASTADPMIAPSQGAHVVLDHCKESPHTAGWSSQLGLSMHFLSETEWRTAFERVGFGEVELQRVLDSRGPGTQAQFQPSAHCPDWKTRVELHSAGSLWIHAKKAK